MWTWEGPGMQKWSSHFAHWCLLLVKGSRPRLRLQWIPVHFHFSLLGVQLSFSVADPSCPAVTPGPPQALSHQLWGSSQEEQTPFPWGLYLPPSHTYSSSWKSPTSRLPWELWLISLCWGWFTVFLFKSILPSVPLATVYALTAEVHSLHHNTHKGLHPWLDPEWCLPGKPLNQKPWVRSRIKRSQSVEQTESPSWEIQLCPVCMCAQSWPTLCDSMNCSPHGLFQARTQEWVAISWISPTQGLNPHLLSLLHWQEDSLPLAPPGKPTLCAHLLLYHQSHDGPHAPLRELWPVADPAAEIWRAAT